MPANENNSGKRLENHRETDPQLLTILVCPLTGGPLSLSRDRTELVSSSAKLAFPIRDGIPIMVQSEARKLPEKKTGTK